MWSVKCGVWSVECGVWSVECRVWSVECRVWIVECHKVPRVPRKTTWALLVTRRKRHVFATFPIGTATFTLSSVKINVFLRVFLWTYCKINVSCEASVDFHDISQNATPATEFAPCHHFAQRWQYVSRKTCNTTCPKQNEIGGVQSAAPATKNAAHLLKM